MATNGVADLKDIVANLIRYHGAARVQRAVDQLIHEGVDRKPGTVKSNDIVENSNRKRRK